MVISQQLLVCGSRDAAYADLPRGTALPVYSSLPL